MRNVLQMQQYTNLNQLIKENIYQSYYLNERN